MPNGPFQITRHVSYGVHTGDPIHRCFQMWQRVNGGKNDMFVWVGSHTGPGPSNAYPLAPGHTFQGGVAMGFHNMASGDASYFKHLADPYAIADNYHQPIMGGTAANYLARASADLANACIPANRPALGNMMNLFDFKVDVGADAQSISGANSAPTDADPAERRANGISVTAR